MKIKLAKPQVETLELSALEWDLYTVRYPEDCRRAAEELNGTILRAINRGATRDETKKAALACMRKHADRGAMDSEPLAILEDVLERIYRY